MVVTERGSDFPEKDIFPTILVFTACVQQRLNPQQCNTRSPCEAREKKQVDFVQIM